MENPELKEIFFNRADIEESEKICKIKDSIYD